MEIISYNVNQFLGTDSFRSFTHKETEKITRQKVYFKKILDYVCNLISDTDNLVILEEVPYSKQREIYNLILSYFSNKSEYEIKFPTASNGKSAFFCTVAIYHKDSNWEQFDVDENNFLSKKVRSVLYHNRVIGMKHNDLKVLGIHIPAANYEPEASVLWDDLLYYCRDNKIDFILGDLNVDVDDTIQARKYKELMQIYHEPNNQPATKICVGMPITNHICKSHIDYALVKTDSCIESLIDEYRIVSDIKDSDHYPIILGLKCGS